jgi:hypothetical protein
MKPWALLALALAPAPASALPPPASSDDYKIMHPFADWVLAQHGPKGQWCCDIGDGRPVDSEIRKGADGSPHWFAHIEPKHWAESDQGAKSGTEVDRWVEVPDDTVAKNKNPMGIGILWWYGGHVQCFSPPAGT